MELDQLIAFERVVREGSFSRAAIGLGIGQPAVSSRIQGLEEAVGGTLFSRGRRIRLTTLGESFLPYARRVLEVLREGVQVARLAQTRSEEHTSELQSPDHLVCRLLLEKKKTQQDTVA